MRIAEALINHEEENNSDELIKKLKSFGFLLNDNFKHYIVPISDTKIIKYRGLNHTLIIQERI